MDLNEYLQLEGAPSVCELRRRMALYGSPVKSDAQIRQWQHRYARRVPSPVNCVAIEYATGGRVTRKDLRPHDWACIWPELACQPTPLPPATLHPADTE
ncbi:transcriptional regulator [Xylophilus sp. ASV27]|uniref:transcriptional regulator n=1 Tax=Xylophilus sp. ASV27 TaxID=2795129 RepID=UPI0018EBD6F6|nr:YdaS family helix-turn-helix protein [Xylophilus sp. ASV27]